MKNVLDKSCREYHNTHFIFHIFFPHENRAVYEVEHGGAIEATNDNTIWRMRVACWISKATRSHAHAYSSAPSFPHTHARARASAPAHARTHTYIEICNIYCFSTATMVS